MTDETMENPLAPYADVAGDVVRLIGDRVPANGDPEATAVVLGGLLEVYTRAVGPTRPFGPADAFVLQILESVAYVASGGVQAQRFRDVAAAALAGSLHVERVTAAMRARQAEPQTGKPQKLPDHPPHEDVDADELRMSDEELFRRVSTPGEDPWAGIMSNPVEGEERVRLDHITQDDLQDRFDRIHAITDTRTPPGGMSREAWEDRKRHVLPMTHGDQPEDDQEGDVRAVSAERERAAALRSTPEGMDADEDQEGDPRADTGPRPIQVKEGEEIPRHGTPGQVVVGVAADGRTFRIGSFSASGDLIRTAPGEVAGRMGYSDA